MTRLRTAQMIAPLLIGVAIAMLLYGWVRLPIAILCFVCLVLFATAEALRGEALKASKAKP